VLILKGLTLRQNCAHLLRMIEDHRRGQGLATTIPGRYRTRGIRDRQEELPRLGWKRRSRDECSSKRLLASVRLSLAEPR